MADLIYKNTPYGDVTVLDIWPQSIKDQWTAALAGYTPIIKPFTPSFRQAHGYYTGDNPPAPWPLNSEYFATMETAQYIAAKYGNGTVDTRPFGGSGGLFTADQDEFWITLPSGKQVNAGILA